MDRRQFLTGLGAASLGTMFTTPAIGEALTKLSIAQANATQALPVSREAHAIARLTYGVTPDLYEHVQQVGVEAFVEAQLAPDNIDDSALRERLEAHALVLDATTADIVKQYAFQPQVIGRAVAGAWVLRRSWVASPVVRTDGALLGQPLLHLRT